MPIVEDRNRVTGDPTKVYAPATGMFLTMKPFPRAYCGGWLANMDSDAGAKLCALRKESQSNHQAFIAAQKQCAKSGDMDGARFFKEEAAFNRRRYNATLFLIPHFAEPEDITGDCRPLIDPWYWPLDLADDFDSILLQCRA